MLDAGRSGMGPDANEVMASVREAIADLLERADRPVPAINAGDDLMATGLTSLDLAAVIAMLETRWGVDPFLEHVPITEVRTVGELCEAYRMCASGQALEADDAGLQRATARAARRSEPSRT